MNILCDKSIAINDDGNDRGNCVNLLYDISNACTLVNGAIYFCIVSVVLF